MKEDKIVSENVDYSITEKKETIQFPFNFTTLLVQIHLLHAISMFVPNKFGWTTERKFEKQFFSRSSLILPSINISKGKNFSFIRQALVSRWVIVIEQKATEIIFQNLVYPGRVNFVNDKNVVFHAWIGRRADRRGHFWRTSKKSHVTCIVVEIKK